MLYKTDFHIHSCLSPCASLEMSPRAIVEQAKEAGLNGIALSDHNCGMNLPAFAAVCEELEMDCLYGMEVTSAEEAHILCLFDDLDQALAFGERVYDSLPPIENDPEKFGDQPVVTADDEVLDFAEKLLLSATEFDSTTLLNLVHEHGGLCIPAHIDRQVYGIIAQLGFLPPDPFDAVELTAFGDPGLAGDYPIIRNSDAHQLDAIGRAHSEFELETLTVAELKAALGCAG